MAQYQRCATDTFQVVGRALLFATFFEFALQLRNQFRSDVGAEFFDHRLDLRPDLHDLFRRQHVDRHRFLQIVQRLLSQFA